MTKSDLIKKYDVPGPRYTSYPTVPYWADVPSQDDWTRHLTNELKRGRENNLGAAVYIHLPFCESLCTYCGCNTKITKNHGVARPYVHTVLKEWDLVLNRIQMKPKIEEIHLGGGTPTFLSEDELSFLIDDLVNRADVATVKEFSLEADPRVTRESQLKVLAERGFTRLSLGIQDFDPKVQSIVNRVQTEEQVKDLVDKARSLGYNSINFDLIYGLPLQTRKSIEDTIMAVIRLKPDRIAFYAYAHVPWIKPGQRKFTEADLPAGTEKRELYELGRQLLESAGYAEIGMDHFALKSDGLYKAMTEKTLHRNFMGYVSQKVTPLFGLGVSAISDAWTAFGQNEKLIDRYEQRVQQGEMPIFRGHFLTEADLIIRKHILELMTRFETTFSDARPGSDFAENVLNRLKDLEADRLVSCNHAGPLHMRVTEDGRAFLRNICMTLDQRLHDASSGALDPSKRNLFSKTV